MKKAKKQPFAEEQKTLLSNWDDYKGKIVAVIGKKIFSAKTGSQAKKIIEKLEKKYKRPPLVTYIPKADTLILFFNGC